MDPRDDDIQFDFFDEEPATTEAQSSQSRVRLPRRGGRGTGMGGGLSAADRGLTPLLRLLALITIIVAALVFFGQDPVVCVDLQEGRLQELHDQGRLGRP